MSLTTEKLTKSAIILSGDSLTKIEMNKKLQEEFLKVAEKSSVVLACRVSPK